MVKSCYLDCAIVLQCVVEQGRLGRGLLRGRHGGYSSSHREDIMCCCFQKNSGGEVAKENEIMGSINGAVALKTVARFKNS